MSRKGRRPTPEAARFHVAQLEDLGARMHTLERLISQRAHDARENGATWGNIGDALGISPQAAQQRFGKGGETDT